MWITSCRAAAAVLGAAAATMLPAVAAVAGPATPSPGAVTVTKAGTSFLTATGVGAGQPVQVAASTGEYLYWSFAASAGQSTDVTATVSLPPAADRHGASTWTVEVFDGLRRRHSCVAGAQGPTAVATDTTVMLGCTLSQVRAWAEPWSADPLPGTYYVRLSVIDLPEQDLGQPIQVGMSISAVQDAGSKPEGGQLTVPLVSAVKPGTVVAAADAATIGGAGQTEETHGWLPDLPALSSRWIWTTVGGILAAVAGVVGFSMTWRPRRPPAP